MEKIRRGLDKIIPNRDWHIIGATTRALGEICALGLLFYHLLHSQIESYNWLGKLFVWFPFALLIIALAINIYDHVKQKKFWKNEKKSLERAAKFSKVISKINRGFRHTHHLLGTEMDSTKSFQVEINNAINDKGITVWNSDQHKIAVERIREILKKSLEQNIRKESYLEAIQKFCDDLSEAFTEIIGSHSEFFGAKCSICLKANRHSPSMTDPKEYKVFTLVRDRNSIERYGSDFDLAKDRYYYKNTAFQKVWESILNQREIKYFFSNSLPKEVDNDYQNESFNDKGVTTEYLKRMPIDERRREDIWPLHYKSTIVAPVFSSHINNGTEKDRILGFLCLDCNYENVFLEAIDVPLFLGCAEGIFNVVKQFQHKFLN